ncbi:MAG: phosphate ABC transporter, permease protein PstA [Candidatus Fraserbacteria bacterium RBG_16_55_9]|uniref:Phosphate transport system permease protein PstA n=1 Tax=Fraserbacteria sp. (strain RBG_16_55_9) TaxID=1817864 RepID=A0A1F5UP69_FRAXR|nr:MAG: phosphate ABC transporter, permease protein PstA [Candidatus Fraserbacteria bacterium RBG_16_55_9]
MRLSLLIVLGGLATILIVTLFKGLPALTLEMVTQGPQGGFYLGKGGGILNAILGSLCLAGGATLIALLISLPIALFLQPEYAGRTRLATFARFSLDVLWGVPSIVYGAFGFTLMVYLGIRASLLGGIIALTLLVLPIMARAMDEVVRSVPAELKESSYTLGATRLETSLGVVVRQALPGICTAVLLSFGRAIGDAASVLFTAGYTDSLPSSLLRPVASLPLTVFFQLGTPFPKVQERAYAAALVLTVIVLTISILSRLLTRSFTKHITK